MHLLPWGWIGQSLGAECWTRQPSEVPANLKYFMILWNLTEMLSLHFCISCVATFNQTTKENTPNIWDSKHIHTNNKEKEEKKKPIKTNKKIPQNILKNHDGIWMLNLAKKSSANFWLTLNFFILVRKHCMTKII